MERVGGRGPAPVLRKRHVEPPRLTYRPSKARHCMIILEGQTCLHTEGAYSTEGVFIPGLGVEGAAPLAPFKPRWRLTTISNLPHQCPGVGRVRLQKFKAVGKAVAGAGGWLLRGRHAADIENSWCTAGAAPRGKWGVPPQELVAEFSKGWLDAFPNSNSKWRWSQKAWGLRKGPT